VNLTINQALKQAITAHQAGRVQDAERVYRAILQSQPLHPDANHNLGVILVSANKPDMALPLFKTALDINPNIEQFWVSCIDALVKVKNLKEAKQAIKKAKKRGFNAKKLQALICQSERTVGAKLPSHENIRRLLEYYQNGRYGDAEKLAISITQEFPKHQFGWGVLGAIYWQSGRHSEAVNANQKAVILSPHDADAHSNLGTTLRELRRLDEAEASYRQATALKPNFFEAHSNLGVVLQELGRLDEAEASYNLAITLKPDFAEAHNNLGNTLQELGRLDQAEASYRQAIALKPDFTEAHSNLGVVLQKLGRLDEALNSEKQAIALNPDFAESHYNLGTILKELGRLEQAEASYRQAIVLKDDYAKAHLALTSMKKFNAQDTQYFKMLEQYSDENISDECRCQINFGLAKACEDLEDFEQAFLHYTEGNALRKKLLNYNIDRDVELFTRLKCSYLKIEKNSLEPDKLSKNLMPIFIVGMPRSGTTLVEQIISSHSQVTAAGELPFAAQFGAAIAHGFSEATDESLLNFRTKYLKKLESFSNGNSIITDKMPQNFHYLGLLASAFPEAKIVHVKRNPAAVCWANYKQYFESKNIGYCYAIDDIVSYYKLYENLMDFWISKLSKRIYNLDYELLTINQESETRQLIEYLGLDWDENCLSPQNNTRSVGTASNLQVRQKVYKGSSEQWKKYKPFLNGVFDQFSS